MGDRESDEVKLRQIIREELRQSVMDMETVFMVVRSGIERPWLQRVILDELRFLVTELDGIATRQQNDELILDLPRPTPGTAKGYEAE